MRAFADRHRISLVITPRIPPGALLAEKSPWRVRSVQLSGAWLRTGSFSCCEHEKFSGPGVQGSAVAL